MICRWCKKDREDILVGHGGLVMCGACWDSPGGRRISAEPERRALRLRLQKALASGDRDEADRVQRLLLECLRKDRDGN